MDLKQHSNGSLPRTGIGLSWGEIKQGWWVNLLAGYVMVLQFGNFVLWLLKCVTVPIVKLCTFTWNWSNTLKMVCLKLKRFYGGGESNKVDRWICDWLCHVGSILKFCSWFLKCVAVPNWQTLYLFMDLKQHHKGDLPHIGMVLSWGEIKQCWWVNLSLVVSWLWNLEILFLTFEGCNYAQLSNFVPFHGPEATPQRRFAWHWKGFILGEKKTSFIGEFVTCCVLWVKFGNFVLDFWSV